MWKKTNDIFPIPDILKEISQKYQWLNIEAIGGKIIELHLRYNDDFAGHNSNTIIPVWKDKFYKSECGDRLGFILVDNI